MLVALAVVGVSATIRGSQTTEPYYAAAHALTPGQVLSEDDLVIVRVRVATGAYVPGPGAADAVSPVGQVVTRTVGDGELLPVAALADPEEFDARPVAVRTALPVAEGIGPGSIVDVYLTTTEDDEVTSRLVAESLVVQSVDSDSGGFSGASEETVYVVVPKEQIADFLAALATEGDISVVGLAGGDA